MTSPNISGTSQPSSPSGLTIEALKSELTAVQKDADLLRRRSNTLTTLLVTAFVFVFGSMGLTAYQIQRQSQQTQQADQAAQITSVESATKLQSRLEAAEKSLQELTSRIPENSDAAVSQLSEDLTQITQELGVQKQAIQTIGEELQKLRSQQTTPAASTPEVPVTE